MRKGVVSEPSMRPVWGLRRSEEGIRWMWAQWKRPWGRCGPLAFINAPQRATTSGLLCDSACLPTQEGKTVMNCIKGKEIRLLLGPLESKMGKWRKSERERRKIKHHGRKTRFIQRKSDSDTSSICLIIRWVSSRHVNGLLVSVSSLQTLSHNVFMVS